jgi:outer membrane lipoprotein-sorting protein
MRIIFMLFLLTTALMLSACGASETATSTSLQAEQAALLKQQSEQLKQQIEAANAQNQKRLQQTDE